MIKKIKNFIIKLLGGYTAEEYNDMAEKKVDTRTIRFTTQQYNIVPIYAAVSVDFFDFGRAPGREIEEKVKLELCEILAQKMVKFVKFSTHRYEGKFLDRDIWVRGEIKVLYEGYKHDF